ncbi:GumC family protein [Sphingomonas sp. C3-2]|uniref:GumC family protein n=1 Tax=Sphingomonas sp. C3-2 TaxID=3062169 RepID=UPI00294AD7D1|nr:AAA family ATPase [Sphingomonas sp. C3-2]WOK36431.1 AAA family ATPase [Sphingomonas sp. C3-2]
MNRATGLTHDARPVRANDDSGELLDLRAIGRTIRHRAVPIALATLAAFVLTGILYFLSEPKYTATASLLVERQQEEVIPSQPQTPALATDSPAVDTTVQVLKSSAIAGRVVDALKLTQFPEFNPDLAEGKASNATPAALRDRAIRILLGGLVVKREGLSYAIAVSYQSPDPEMAMRVANGVIDAYLASNIALESDSTKRATDLLRTRLDELRQQVLAAESAVARYRDQNQLFAISDVSSVTQQELSVLNNQLAEAKAAEAAATARLATARAQLAAGRSGDTMGEALNSQVVGALRAQRAQLSAQVANLATRYGPRHPERVKAESQLNDVDRQISGEVGRIMAGLGTEARVAQQRSGSIAASIGQVEGRLADANSASVRLSELERNAESARVLYRAFLDRYKEAVARQGTEPSGARPIARAQMPIIPTSPNPLMFLGIALVAAAAMSLAVVLVMQFLEAGLKTSEQVEKKLGVASLGSIPELSSLPELRGRGDVPWPPQYLVEHPKSAYAESFRVLKTALTFAPGADPVRIVAVTSSLPDEGKTTSAIALARVSALSGARTLLVDCDTRRRASSTLLSKNAPFGLGDVLEKRCALEQALVLDEASGAQILGQKQGAEIPFELLGSEQMVALMNDLRSKFDFVVLDTSPVLPVAEARVLSARADAVLLLVQWRATPAKAAELALNELQGVGAKVAGVALSRVDVREQARSGFGDAGLYFGRYKEYYA